MEKRTLQLEAAPVSRSNGDRVVAKAAYRAGQNLTDEKHKAHCRETGHSYRGDRYAWRRDVVAHGISLPEKSEAPSWMQDGDERQRRERIWNEAEKAEDTSTRRGSAQTARSIMVPLPRELSEEQNMRLALQIQTVFAKQGILSDWAFHLDPAADGGENPHLHILLATREVTPQGFGKKLRDMDKKATLIGWRKDVTDCFNKALDDAGLKHIRYTPESYKAQGLDKKPGRKMGKQAAAMEKEGIKTRIGAYNRKVGFDNIMRPYEKAGEESEEPWAFQPPAAEKDWHKRVAEWQLLRGSAMAARDAKQKSESNVTAPPATRAGSNTEMVREGAKLAHRQSRTWQEKVKPSRSREPEMER